MMLTKNQLTGTTNMRTFKIIAVAIITMYIGVEMISNIEDDYSYMNNSDVRVRMQANSEAYDAKYNR